MQRLFSLGARGGLGAAAAAASASPSTASCYAQTPRRSILPRTKDESNQLVVEESLQAQQSWILPDLQEGEVYFQPEEIEESVVQLFDTVYRSGKPCQAGSSHEDAETDAESVESMGAEANLLMEEADRSLAPRKMENVLINMLKQPGVQQACLSALMADEGFRDMVNHGRPLLEDANPARNAADVIIEEMDDADAREERHPMSGLMEALGSHFAKLGEGLKRASSTIGNFLVDLGYKLHSILGKPATEGKPAPDGVPKKLQEEWWARAFMTVACGIFVVMVLKRLPPA
ncbi:hypothetical protein WJX84_006667 [Apatococcus fuscideae]|uniref:Uncharacterized protein n=1 Tax=Apatococcus fuscideae TaxID=2026836 RepID=A0AAW1SMJ9_9CHLO